MATRFVIIGGGPAGNQAATHAARLGAEVTLIERDIVGGAAHLLGLHPVEGHDRHRRRAHRRSARRTGMGLATCRPRSTSRRCGQRIDGIEGRLAGSVTELLESQGVA